MNPAQATEPACAGDASRVPPAVAPNGWIRAPVTNSAGGLSDSTIGRIWRRFELRPHLTDGFKLSTDPPFVEKVIDVAGLYHNPPERAVVLCVDEKTQVQALDRSQPVLPSSARCTSPGSRFVPARTITMAGAGLDGDPPICAITRGSGLLSERYR